jgi:hypothetical protein
LKRRWDTIVEDINLARKVLKSVIRRANPYKKKGRGTNPKHSVDAYLELIVLTEYDERTLRGGEVRLSEMVCGERVDHSVIHYWQSKPEVVLAVRKIIAVAGAILQRILSSLFTFVDSTKFAGWQIEKNMKLTEVTVCNKIAKETVYPIGISFLRDTVASPVKEAVPKGTGKIKADAWYDEKETIKYLFKSGYIPIICPNKNRIRGFYRQKAREVYKLRENRLAYKQRGRGESLFGSITNQYGDRLNTLNVTAQQTRIASRILSHQIKLLLRAGYEIRGYFLDTLSLP